MKRLVIFSVCGAVIGGLIEYVHFRSGVWVLPRNETFPVWVAPAYFVVLLGVGLGLRRFDAHFGRPAVSPRVLTVEALLVSMLTLAPPLLHRHEVVLALAVCAYLMVRLLLRRTTGDVAVVFFAALANHGLELTLVWLSLYRYANADLWVLPLWLAPLWGGMGLGLRRIFAVVAPVTSEPKSP